MIQEIPTSFQKEINRMPYTRIYFSADKPASCVRANSNALHCALVDSFEVPPLDRFKVFMPLQPGEFVSDAEFLSGPRSDNFTLFAATTGKPRSAGAKREFYRRLVELLPADPGIHAEDVMNVLSHSQSEDWSFGGGRVWNELPKKTIN